jgi:endonuclease/exonuclease/phosphatase family metal-dependent hydrolase
VRWALICAALLLMVAGCQHLRLSRTPTLDGAAPGSIRVATWNVHYIDARSQEGRWGLARWERRKQPLSGTFARLDADIIAFQEMETFEGGDDDTVNLARDWLLGNHPDYAAAAVGDWRRFPSTQPIFYRKAGFDLVEQGWFFFSETPEVIYSRTFDGSYPAFASWAVFRQRRTGQDIRVVNVHLDYSSRENRRRSVALLAARVADWTAAGDRVALLADLNALSGSALHDSLEQAGLRFVDVPGASFHFDRGLHLFGAIDHIGLGGGLAPIGPAQVVRSVRGDSWPSDHHPVVLDLRVE